MKKLAILTLSAAALALCACNEQKNDPAADAQKAASSTEKSLQKAGAQLEKDAKKAADETGKAAADAEKKAGGFMSDLSNKVKDAGK